MTQDEALQILKMGHNVFLTGAAGSGKTYVLNRYISFLKESGISVAVTASTGIAATHLGGTTIHSWSGLGIRRVLEESDVRHLLEKRHLKKRYEKTRVLVIDEVSMLHHFMFDMLDKMLRSFRKSDRPFGGIQVVLCGDFFQLPPVSREYEGEAAAKFAYHADAWNAAHPVVCYLSEQHRQKNDVYLRLLNEIRAGAVSDGMRQKLQSRFETEFASAEPPTKLHTHNVDVDRENERELGRISGESVAFEMKTRGRKKMVELLKKSLLAPERLVLKKGARVMFVKNNFDKGYANGTLGTVHGFDQWGGYPIVETSAGETITAEPEEWVIEEDGEIRAVAEQVPLRLAWAITVHKSQGMSLDAAEMDLSKSFELGMGYVALSRLRSLDGLKLVGMNERALAVSSEAMRIDGTFLKKSEMAANRLQEIGEKEIRKRQEEFIRKNKPEESEEEEKLDTYQKTALLVAEKMPLKKIARTRGLKLETVLDHLEKLSEKGTPAPFEYLRAEVLPDEARFSKITKALLKSYELSGAYRLTPAKEILGDDFSFLEIRIARLFVKKPTGAH